MYRIHAVSLLSFCLLSGSAFAATFPVDTLTDAVDASPGDGVCATSGGECSLRAAVMEANAFAGPDVITLGGGTHTLTIPGDEEDGAASGDLDVTESVDILSTPGILTTIDAANLDRVIHVLDNAGEVTLFGLVLTNGRVFTDSGGGLFASSGNDVTVSFCIVRNNVANSGGGIFTAADPLLMQYSAVLDNTVVEGGATNPWGSGIQANVGRLRLEASVVYDNRGPRQTGAINASNGDVQLFSSTISGNTYGKIPELPDDGLVMFNVDAILQNVTIADQARGVEGGAFSPGQGTLFMRNSLIATEDAACSFRDNNITLDIDGYNATTDSTCNLPVGNNLEGLNAKISPLIYYGLLTPAHLPLPDSALIDSGSREQQGVGDPEACFPFDQQNLPRDPCDIGAVEYVDYIYGDNFEPRAL